MITNNQLHKNVRRLISKGWNTRDIKAVQPTAAGRLIQKLRRQIEMENKLKQVPVPEDLL